MYRDRCVEELFLERFNKQAEVFSKKAKFMPQTQVDPSMGPDPPMQLYMMADELNEICTMLHEKLMTSHKGQEWYNEMSLSVGVLQNKAVDLKEILESYEPKTMSESVIKAYQDGAEHPANLLPGFQHLNKGVM